VSDRFEIVDLAVHGEDGVLRYEVLVDVQQQVRVRDPRAVSCELRDRRRVTWELEKRGHDRFLEEIPGQVEARQTLDLAELLNQCICDVSAVLVDPVADGKTAELPLPTKVHEFLEAVRDVRMEAIRQRDIIFGGSWSLRESSVWFYDILNSSVDSSVELGLGQGGINMVIIQALRV
jgi:hypothetical protein